MRPGTSSPNHSGSGISLIRDSRWYPLSPKSPIQKSDRYVNHSSSGASFSTDNVLLSSFVFCILCEGNSKVVTMGNDGEELFKSPLNSKNHSPATQKPEVVDNGRGKAETLFSPRFRSAAEMAGWDEEALLIASLIVEDTPDRHIKQKKRSLLPNLKTPPTNSRR